MTTADYDSPPGGETEFVDLPNWRGLHVNKVWRKHVHTLSNKTRSSRRGAASGLSRGDIHDVRHRAPEVLTLGHVGELSGESDRISTPLTLSTLAENVGESNVAADISGILAHNRKSRHATHPSAIVVTTRTEVAQQQANTVLARQLTTVSSMQPDSQQNRGTVDDMIHAHFMNFMRLYLCDYGPDGHLPSNWAGLVVNHLTSLSSLLLRANDDSGLSSGRANPCCDVFAANHLTHWNSSFSSSLTRLRVADFILRELSLEYEESLSALKYSAPEKENIIDATLKREGNETLKLSAEQVLNEYTTPSQPLTSNDGLAIPTPMFRSTMSSGRGGVQLSAAELGKSPDAISFETDGQLEHSAPHIGDLMEDVILQEELENSGGSPYKKNTVFHGSGKTSAARGDFLQHLALSKLTHKDKSSIYITKGTSAPSSGAHIDPGEVEDPATVSSRRVAEKLYFLRRGCRKLYQDASVHAAMIELLLLLLVHVKPAEHSEVDRKYISSRYADEEAQTSKKRYLTQLHFEKLVHGVHLLLQAHLNHAGNASVVSALVSRVGALGNDVERLLRLSSDAFFSPERYATKRFVAKGAFAEVYRCDLPYELGTLRSMEVAVKVIDTAQNVRETFAATAVYSEIALLEAMEREPFVVKLLDYGVSKGSFFIVMQHYPTSLKQWRTNHGHVCDLPGEILCTSRHLLLYSAIYAQCLEAVAALERFGVVHYDIKADNFLLEPTQGCSVSDFWNPPERSTLSAFRIVITDFGESRSFGPSETEGTLRNRGTEYIKAPEMLTVSTSSKMDANSYDRRKSKKCGHPADIWALGCLLYEIITNSFLLYDPDWIRFFLRTVTPNSDLLPPQSVKELDSMPSIKHFIMWLLVRDPSLRPNLAKVRTKFASLRMTLDPDFVSPSDEFASIRLLGSDSPWSTRAGVSAPLETKWPVESNESRRTSLSCYLPTTANRVEENSMMHPPHSAADISRLAPGKIFRAFRSASRLNGVHIGNLDSVVGMSVQELQTFTFMVCSREQSVDDDMSTPCASDEFLHIDEYESDTIINFTKRLAAIGVTMQRISLPSISDFSLGANSLFTQALQEVEHLFARICELETRNDDQMNGGYHNQHDRSQRDQILILCAPSDWTTALGVAAALHMYVRGGGVRAAVQALSVPDNSGFGFLTLHPTDVARLTAWEARKLATTQQLSNITG
jgi:serine/threonine protein kinase